MIRLVRSLALTSLLMSLPLSASALGISISGFMTSTGSTTLFAGDTVTVDLVVENNTNLDINGHGLVATGYDNDRNGIADSGLALLMLVAEAAPCPFLASPSHALRGNPTNYNLPTDHPLVRALCSLLGPLLSTSANPPRRPAPRTCPRGPWPPARSTPSPRPRPRPRPRPGRSRLRRSPRPRSRPSTERYVGIWWRGRRKRRVHRLR